jgi:hypothetical protein
MARSNYLTEEPAGEVWVRKLLGSRGGERLFAASGYKDGPEAAFF